MDNFDFEDIYQRFRVVLLAYTPVLQVDILRVGRYLGYLPVEEVLEEDIYLPTAAVEKSKIFR